MDVSVTKANLNNASFQWDCNLATLCSVLVPLCLRKAQMFSGVEGSIQCLTEAKRKGRGQAHWACLHPLVVAYDGKIIISNESVSAHLLLQQVLKTIWHPTKNHKRFKFCFSIGIFFHERNWPLIADLTQWACAILWTCSEQLVNPMLKVFLLIGELLMLEIFLFIGELLTHSILSFFLSLAQSFGLISRSEF